jgi:hypothetical protein
VFEYRKYWDAIKPTDDDAYYKMFLFAYMSVHTGWKSNVKGYEALVELLEANHGFMPGSPKNDVEKELDDELWVGLSVCGAGLTKRRYIGISKFSAAFRTNADWFKPAEGETIKACRDRLEPTLYGLGLAKTSFAMEMAFPHSQDVVCLDTHMIQLYKVKDRYGNPVKGSINDNTYREIESHWCKQCRKIGVPSPIARHVWWDRKQKQSGTDYWSYVFRKDRDDTTSYGGAVDREGNRAHRI